MAKKNILILSEKNADAEDVLETYSQAGGYAPSLVYEVNDALSELLTTNIELLVYNVQSFTMKKLQSVLDLRDLGADFPVLTLANQTEENAYSNVSHVEGALILEKPYDKTQLLEISTKMMVDGKMVRQRLYRRFATKEIAYLNSRHHGESAEVKLINLSKNGAKLESKTELKISAQEEVSIVFILSNNKKHTKRCKVVWSNFDRGTKTFFFGVTFSSH